MTLLGRAGKAALENWPVKLTALLLAAVLWVVVAAEEPAIELMTVPLVIELPAGRSLMDEPRPVEVTFTGPARELFKLYATPATIIKSVPDTAADSVYTLDLRPTDVELPKNVAARIQEVRPRSVMVRLNPVAATVASVDSIPAGDLSDRVLMGVPVSVHGEQGGVWSSDPPAVMVMVHGPGDRVARLTRDSVQVTATPAGSGRPETVRLQVAVPAGVAGTPMPDTAVVRRRIGG
jgi:hypothetical protein